MNGEIYKRYSQGRAKKSPILKNCVNAYIYGGLICTVAQALTNLYKAIGMPQDKASSVTSITLIFITAVLTGLGWFDNIAKKAGGGTLVPITGFANAISAASIDNKTEGYVLGVGTKIFSVAGPVILYGTSAGVIYGIIYWLTGMIFG